jgi:hypothetical protein
MSENQQTPGETKYTPEQIAEMRAKMIKHYQGEIKFLKIQAEFEKLQADVEEHRARRYSAMAHQAQLFADPEKEGDVMEKEENEPVLTPGA